MGRILGITLALGLYSILTVYLGLNLKKWLESINLFRWPVFYWLLLFLVSFSFIIGRLRDSLKPLIILGNYWMFFLEYGLLLCILANLVIYITPYKNVPIMGSIVMGLLVILFAWGSYNAYSPVVRNLEISIDRPGEPLRLVVASDFHLGVLSHKDHLQRFVELSNEAKPDAVLLVGDIVDDDPIWFVDEGMNEVMKQLTSTYGVYGVLGNHEYYGGKIPEFIDEMKESNVQILLDETILVGNRFYLTGREDLTNAERKELEALKPESGEHPWIVMNHTPQDLQEAEKAGVDFHVSGHTHLGQLWPNNFITNQIFEVDYGHLQKDASHFLVSSGFGFWGPPMRIGSRSELWVVDISFNEESVGRYGH
ncbi:metallophosphoesterase [Lysinibacillus yapensis]|uniref:Metallophosphoesterase n=1 Tax=Ureibacillus yapensis TaxID=2304605 RepID=A0A396S672_9BACL|nr:metallophosphoesterase [Lysinibacillus yapensis]RHW35811.1 metallophosphoesterase [Lysinibacillus yapensis]